MKAIQELQEAFQTRLKRERLQLITEWKAAKVEALDEMKIVDAYWLRLYEYYRLVLDYGGKTFEYDVGTKLVMVTPAGELLMYSWDESKKIEKWLEELDVYEHLDAIKEEKNAAYFQQVKAERMRTQIENMELKDGEIVYTLSNGKTFTEQIPSKRT